uniref:Uncharacterized protein n=1 Tax=Chromera velia CCMP2878 TaxID=1169474 RepID=A0A0G4H9D6_9ALVE|eukprot:Cvel_25390.t1-p1 / transcript=Cvel_25390.t1 / gene=Cvel_25390 / organism=Chromera_velia_CCMP2878 / gene_product=hypothetical protein / transcript_product=hypothetical protein / location=Cvel_scaffold2870:9998-11672(+) / protein_length=371 / sequence_SO=supercontig / SO=protein_coding / is_pseudo=false
MSIFVFLLQVAALPSAAFGFVFASTRSHSYHSCDSRSRCSATREADYSAGEHSAEFQSTRRQACTAGFVSAVSAVSSVYPLFLRKGPALAAPSAESPMSEIEQLDPKRYNRWKLSGEIPGRGMLGGGILSSVLDIRNGLREIAAVSAKLGGNEKGKRDALESFERLQKVFKERPLLYRITDARRVFNDYSDEIFFRNPDKEGAYLQGNVPTTFQTTMYLQRNRVLDALEQMTSEMRFLANKGIELGLLEGEKETEEMAKAQKKELTKKLKVEQDFTYTPLLNMLPRGVPEKPSPISFRAIFDPAFLYAAKRSSSPESAQSAETFQSVFDSEFWIEKSEEALAAMERYLQKARTDDLQAAEDLAGSVSPNLQ